MCVCVYASINPLRRAKLLSHIALVVKSFGGYRAFASAVLSIVPEHTKKKERNNNTHFEALETTAAAKTQATNTVPIEQRW